jgi:hypothetical protein
MSADVGTEPAYGDDFPPDEEVEEKVRGYLARIFPGLSIETATLTVSFADGTEKSWEVLA